MTQVLARRVPDLMREFTDVLDHRYRIRWVVVWLDCFSGGLIHFTVVMLPCCSEFADSTAASSSLEDGLNDIGINSARIG